MVGLSRQAGEPIDPVAGRAVTGLVLKGRLRMFFSKKLIVKPMGTGEALLVTFK